MKIPAVMTPAESLDYIASQWNGAVASAIVQRT